VTLWKIKLTRDFKKCFPQGTNTMGDFNAKIDKGKCGILMGVHGLGVRN